MTQTGVYSKVLLAGDFEVSATYELIAVPPPEKGYGVTCRASPSIRRAPPAKSSSCTVTRWGITAAISYRTARRRKPA